MATRARKAESAPPLKATTSGADPRQLGPQAFRRLPAMPVAPGNRAHSPVTTRARTSSTAATIPVRNGPNSANRAEPSSKRMV